MFSLIPSVKGKGSVCIPYINTIHEVIDNATLINFKVRQLKTNLRGDTVP